MRAETETVWEQAFRVSSKRPPVDEHIGSRLLNFAPRSPPRLHRRSRKSKVQRPFENAPARECIIPAEIIPRKRERSYRRSC